MTSTAAALVYEKTGRFLWAFVACLLALACGDGEPTSGAADDEPAGPALIDCRQPTPLDCDGRCVAPERDPEACGGCGVACEGGTVCSGGECTAECSGSYPDLCGRTCVDLRSDRDNCGACGEACALGELCSGGVCSGRCGAYAPDQCGDLCVDLRSDTRFCGSCDVSCGDGELCVDGVCASECGSAKPDQCDGRCVDTASDPRFCGSCDSRCGIDEVCSDGRCLSGCSEPTPNFCGGVCVDLQSDARACGSCDAACNPGAVCSRGICALDCSVGLTKCGDECADVASDPQHCGGCNQACPEGQFCSSGQCGDSCGGDTPVQCGPRCVAESEAASCGLACFSATPSVCGNACVDLTSDPKHCGACNAPCKSGQACVSGRCEIACGGSTPELCGEQCVNLEASSQHCGKCGNACKNGEHCVAGNCQPSCPQAEPHVCDGKCVDLQNDEGNCGTCGLACAADQRCNGGDCVLDIVDIVSGATHSCVRTGSNEVSCAGYNSNKQIGDPDAAYGVWAEARVEALGKSVVELVAGQYHNCARLADGKVKCWGANYSGVLGMEYVEGQYESAVPVEIGGFDATPSRIASGYWHACALTTNDEVECWGQADYGALGRGDAELPSHTPDLVANLPSEIGALRCGWYHCCVRREQPSPDIYCWGRTDEGQIGAATPGSTLATKIPDVPHVEEGYELATSFGVGAYHTCALGNDGEVYCWGYNYNYQIGNESESPRPVEQVELPGRAIAVYAGSYSSCALMEDRSAVCWGQHFAGGEYASQALPEEVIGAPLRTLSLGYSFNFGLLEDGGVLSWGSNYLQLRRDPIPLYEPRPCCKDY